MHFWCKSKSAYAVMFFACVLFFMAGVNTYAQEAEQEDILQNIVPKIEKEEDIEDHAPSADDEDAEEEHQEQQEPKQEELLLDIEQAIASDYKKTGDGVSRKDTDEPLFENFEEKVSRPIPLLGNEANPAISIIMDFGAAWFSSRNHYRQGGHSLNSSGPGLMAAELAASASVDPYFRFEMAFELLHLHLEELFAATTSMPLNLQVRAGKYLSDIGRHNSNHMHTWNFVSQPLANEFMFGAEGMSLPGVELSWLAPLPWYVKLIGSLQMGRAGAFATDFSGEPGFKDFIYPLRLEQFFDLHEYLGFVLGMSTVFGTSASAPEMNNRVYAYGIDIMLRWRPVGGGRDGYTHLTMAGEGWYRQMEVALDILEDTGGYLDLLLGISKRWQAGLRGELWRRLKGANQSEELNRDLFGQDASKFSTAFSFLPSHFSKIRLQHSLEKIGNYDLTHSVVLQFEVSAGAHGAHAY